jgi:hypothetical protein
VTRMLAAAYSKNYYERLGRRNEHHKSNIPSLNPHRRSIQRAREKRQVARLIRESV